MEKLFHEKYLDEERYKSMFGTQNLKLETMKELDRRRQRVLLLANDQTVTK